VGTGQLIADRYRLEEQVGSGGMGTVWRATDEQLRRVVAVKHVRLSGDDSDRQRIQREAQIAASLHHPHVVTVFDSMVQDDGLYLIMEYVPSQSLAEILTEYGTLPPQQAAHIGAQIADALAAAHTKGIVHRDVKPGNVLVTAKSIAKLTDFGISRIVGDVRLTQTGVVSGTPAYLAPEVAAGAESSPPSDVFSLGATLYAAVEGTPPFGISGNPLALLRRVAEGRVPPARRAGPLHPVLRALLQRRPAKRPEAQRAQQMLWEAVAQAASGKNPTAWHARRPALAVVGVVTAALAVTASLLTAQLGRSGADATARSSSPPLAATASLGDPRTADPCALTDRAALARFGIPKLATDYANFNRCDILVRLAGGAVIDVKVELENPLPPGRSVPGQLENVGSVVIARQPENAGECRRTLLLADQRRVVITAAWRRETGALDLCPAAEVAATSAIAVLRQGEVPRRSAPPDATSLARVDACALLEQEALAGVPGLNPADQDPGFGGWECQWNSRTTDTYVLVRFDRNLLLTSDDGRPAVIGGRPAFVKPKGHSDDSCQVQLVHRRYQDAAGDPTLELVLVIAGGAQPPDQLCQPAQALAAAVAALLPPR
jgi:eukaryotic-like serine/threonine-protein kinase